MSTQNPTAAAAKVSPLSLTDMLRGGKSQNYHREVVIPESHEDGSDGVLFLKQPSAAFVIKWRRKKQAQIEAEMPGLVIRCLVDENGNRLVKDEDIDSVLERMPMGTFSLLSTIVSEMVSGNALGNGSRPADKSKTLAKDNQTETDNSELAGIEEILPEYEEHEN